MTLGRLVDAQPQRLRLVLGERLDVDVIGHDVLHDLEPDDDRVPIVALYSGSAGSLNSWSTLR